MKIEKKNLGGGWGGVGLGVGIQGGCDLRIKVFGKIHKKNFFFWGGGGRFGGVGSGWM